MAHPSTPAVLGTPIRDFSQCHAGILKKLDMLGELPALLEPADRARAEFEEQAFLPLSQIILGRNSNHLSTLGLSLHMRHTPTRVNSTYV